MADKVEGYFGTTTYMAPEVLNDKWVSHKSDVFSAGLVVASLVRHLFTATFVLTV